MGQPAPAGVSASGLPPAGDQANAVLFGQIAAVGPTACFAFRGPLNLSIWDSINTALTTTAGSLAASVASATGLAIGNAINSVNVPRGTTVGNLVGAAVTLAIPPITLPGRSSVQGQSITELRSTEGLLGATVTGPNIPAGTTVIGIPVAAVAGNNNYPIRTGTVSLSNVPTADAPNNSPEQFFTFARTGNAILTTGADAAATFTGAAIQYNATVQVERSFDGGSTWIVGNIDQALAQFNLGTAVSLTFGEPEREVLYRLNCIAYVSGTINFRFSQTGGAAESLAIGPLSGG